MSREIGLSDLVFRVKQELLSEKARHHDLPPLFCIDEVTLELNFVIHGDVEGGFSLGVVTAGSQVSEERVQKVTVTMSPLLSREELIEELKKRGGEFDWDTLLKGSILGEEP